MKYILSSLSVCMVLVTGVTAGQVTTVENITVEASSGNPMEIFTINGSIDVEEWDSNQVEVVYTITCSNEEELSFITVESNMSNGIICEVDYDDDCECSNCSVDFEVRIPENIDLTIELTSVNGNVSIDGGKGEAILEVVNGNIDAENFSGELEVCSVNGNIEVSDSPGVRIAELVNGNIECVINSLEDDLELETVNGNITLYLGIDALVEIETISGEISIDESFNALITENIVGCSAEFGDGDLSIEISTISGDITILD
ncbi:MAG: hypothetical protein K8R76_07665 [Candidatus Aegiribacteria sp.]|nr:hypothetical protein [Candidatus Aegiribacteria sp.]